jgi:O-antigen ligase
VAAPAIVFLAVVGTSRLAAPASAPNIIQAAGGRLHTIAAPMAESSGQFRLNVWSDTVQLITARPIFGWGLDTFGLVYPQFKTGNWAPGAIIDRPHNELLGVAATQGLLGLAAYGAIALALVRAFWKRRRDLRSVALFGGVLGYAIFLLFNFSYLPAALPFWIFAAAAVTLWDPREPRDIHVPTRLAARIPIALATALVALAAIPLIIAPYAADSAYRSGLDAIAAGHRQQARALVEQARNLAPWQSTYAVAAGSLALDLDGRGRPGNEADWSAARADYTSAIQLGSESAATYRYLAVADQALGMHQEAITAATTAVSLDRYDPANQAELAMLLAR